GAFRRPASVGDGSPLLGPGRRGSSRVDRRRLRRTVGGALGPGPPDEFFALFPGYGSSLPPSPVSAHRAGPEMGRRGLLLRSALQPCAEAPPTRAARFALPRTPVPIARYGTGRSAERREARGRSASGRRSPPRAKRDPPRLERRSPRCRATA